MAATPEESQDPLSAVCSATGPGAGSCGTALTTWHAEARPTKQKPLRLLRPCVGCGRDGMEKDHFFPDEYVRWAYYTIVPKLHATIRQPSGWWCWECDSLADRQPEDKAALKDKLEEKGEYRQRWTEEWLPKQRAVIHEGIARGLDHLPVSWVTGVHRSRGHLSGGLVVVV